MCHLIRPTPGKDGLYIQTGSKDRKYGIDMNRISFSLNLIYLTAEAKFNDNKLRSSC